MYWVDPVDYFVINIILISEGGLTHVKHEGEELVSDEGEKYFLH